MRPNAPRNDVVGGVEESVLPFLFAARCCGLAPQPAALELRIGRLARRPTASTASGGRGSHRPRAPPRRRRRRSASADTCRCRDRCARAASAHARRGRSCVHARRGDPQLVRVVPAGPALVLRERVVGVALPRRDRRLVGPVRDGDPDVGVGGLDAEVSGLPRGELIIAVRSRRTDRRVARCGGSRRSPPSRAVPGCGESVLASDRSIASTRAPPAVVPVCPALDSRIRICSIRIRAPRSAMRVFVAGATGVLGRRAVAGSSPPATRSPASRGRRRRTRCSSRSAPGPCASTSSTPTPSAPRSPVTTRS